MRKILMSSLCLTMTSACAAIGGYLPKTPGEIATNYGYIPLDPLPVDQKRGADSCAEQGLTQSAATGNADDGLLTDKLPDLAVRFAIGEYSANGQLQFGPSKVTSKGSAYRAVLDYVNVDVIPVEFMARKLVRSPDGSDRWFPLSYVVDSKRPHSQGFEVVGYEARIVRAGTKILETASRPLTVGISTAGLNADDPNTFERVTFPVYVGLGLRLSADIRALEGGINLSGLGTIGAQADAKRLTGTLTVQTLGVTGKPIATALPLPNKLDQTTIENGILSIGTSRALLYGTLADGVASSPRVVGLYSPVGSDPRLVNAIYSELSGQRIPWFPPCREAAKKP